MKTEWKPAGHTSVSPYLLVSGAQRLIDFLATVFDAQPVRRYDGSDGSIVHAEVKIDDTVVMLADAAAEWKPAPAMVHVYVADVDRTWQRALDAGAGIVQEPAEKEGDPDRRGGFTDPAGNTWWVATQQSAE